MSDWKKTTKMLTDVDIYFLAGLGWGIVFALFFVFVLVILY